MPEKHEQCDNPTCQEAAYRAVKKVFPSWSSMSINTNPTRNSAADAMHQLIGV